MGPAWRKRAVEIHERFLSLARRSGHLFDPMDITRYLALSLCGEAGELANLVKRGWQGGEMDPDAIRDELADVRIYLELLASYLYTDLDQACERKLEALKDRLKAQEASNADTDAQDR